MPISKQHKCLFIHIPKTGGTSIETALEMFYSWKLENTEALFGLIQSKELLAKGFLSHYLQHLTLRQVLALQANSDELFSFTFVRNPWDRIVSTYHNIDPNLIECATAVGIELRNLPFDEFLARVLNFPHIHLLDQYQFIVDENEQLMVDFLGRFESLETDFDKICQHLNITACLPHKNQSTHLDYRRYYTKATRDLVAVRYQKDIALFQYSF